MTTTKPARTNRPGIEIAKKELVLGLAEVKGVFGRSWDSVCNADSIPECPSARVDLSQFEESVGLCWVLSVQGREHPLTLENIIERRANFASGRLGRGNLFTEDIIEEMRGISFFSSEYLVTRWNLASTRPIPGTAGRNLFVQTQAISEFVERVADIVGRSDQVSPSISEFNSKKSQLAGEFNKGSRTAATSLCNLGLNRCFRASPLSFVWTIMLFEQSSIEGGEKYMLKPGTYSSHSRLEKNSMWVLSRHKGGELDFNTISPFENDPASVSGGAYLFWPF